MNSNQYKITFLKIKYKFNFITDTVKKLLTYFFRKVKIYIIFYQAKKDIKEHDLNYNFASIDDLYLEPYEQLGCPWEIYQ